MVEVQEQLYVEQRIPSPKDQVHRLSMRIDLLRGFGVARN